MAALMERQKTGKGQMVTGALLATASHRQQRIADRAGGVAPTAFPPAIAARPPRPTDIYKVTGTAPCWWP
jgi:crotonobetainyl-CoA:carnitine CoA-transferase CaiB-like acyl-CoA transferase